MSTDRPTRLAREKALFEYTSALDRGDFEAIAAILHAAESDPELARMIEEVNNVVAAEVQPVRQRKPSSQRFPRTFPSKRTWAWIAGVAAVVLFVLFVPVVSLSRTDNTYVGDPRLTAEQRLAITERMASEPNVPLAEWLWQQVTGSESQELAELPVTDEPEGEVQYAQATAPAMPTATPASVVQVTPLSEATAAPTAGSDQGSPVAPQQPMIIKNGEIEIVVEDAQSAIDQVTNIATDNGGYVLSSQSASQNGRATAIMTIAVRAENFEIAMRRLRDIAMEVVRETSSGQDVSTEYVDLQSRLRNLEATRDRIRALLDNANTVEEALEINTQLSDIEAEIEQVKGRMTYLTGRAAFSTITVTLSEYVPTTPTPTPTPTLTPTPTQPWSLGPRIDSAVETQKSMGRGLLELLVWLIIVPGPYLVGLALIVWIVRLAMRRRQP